MAVGPGVVGIGVGDAVGAGNGNDVGAGNGSAVGAWVGVGEGRGVGRDVGSQNPAFGTPQSAMDSVTSAHSVHAGIGHSVGKGVGLSVVPVSCRSDSEKVAASERVAASPVAARPNEPVSSCVDAERGARLAPSAAGGAAAGAAAPPRARINKNQPPRRRG